MNGKYDAIVRLSQRVQISGAGKSGQRRSKRRRPGMECVFGLIGTRGRDATRYSSSRKILLASRGEANGEGDPPAETRKSLSWLRHGPHAGTRRRFEQQSVEQAETWP